MAEAIPANGLNLTAILRLGGYFCPVHITDSGALFLADVVRGRVMLSRTIPPAIATAYVFSGQHHLTFDERIRAFAFPIISTIETPAAATPSWQVIELHARAVEYRDNYPDPAAAELAAKALSESKPSLFMPPLGEVYRNRV